jgi:tetratricopeptide (TPR) repeat protein
VAEALKTVYREDLETVCGQIALHYERAGLPAQAIPFYQQAGAVARRIYAHTEALHEFQQAAALLEQARQNVPWETAAQVYTSCGDIYAETGACEEARQAYQHALTHLPAEAHIWQARLYWKIATTWTYSFARKHDPFYEQSLQAFAKAERLLTQIADPSNPDWREEWLDLQFARIWRGSVNEIETALQRARPIVEQHGTQEQRKLFAEAVGIHNAIRDRFVIPTHRLASWRATIASLEPGGDETQRGIDLALLGIGLLSASQFDEAEEQLRQALHVGERTGNAWLQNNCLTFLPFVLRQRGQVEEVSRLIAQAQSLGLTEHNRIFSGHRAWVAWRQGNLVLAETYGRESVEEPHTPQVRPNPFLWTGRWPLIGIALTRQQVASAIHEIRLLFDPTQQPPRPPLDALLRTVLQTWEAGEPEKASAHLQQAVPLATQMGYL